MIAYMQQVHKGVKGIVTSTDGVPLNASISVEGIDKEVFTDPGIVKENEGVTMWEFGDYYRLLVPGDYKIKASAGGYKSEEKDVTVTNGDAVQLDFILEAGATSLVIGMLPLLALLL